MYTSAVKRCIFERYQRVTGTYFRVFLKGVDKKTDGKIGGTERDLGSDSVNTCNDLETLLLVVRLYTDP